MYILYIYIKYGTLRGNYFHHNMDAWGKKLGPKSNLINHLSTPQPFRYITKNIATLVKNKVETFKGLFVRKR